MPHPFSEKQKATETKMTECLLLGKEIKERCNFNYCSFIYGVVQFL